MASFHNKYFVRSIIFWGGILELLFLTLPANHIHAYTIPANGFQSLYLPLVGFNDSFEKPKGPLRINPTNPRYFTDSSGKAILLTGSHTWANFQDAGTSDPPPVFDYIAYLNFLKGNNHNFFRLWSWEQTKGLGSVGNNFWITPTMYQRTGPGTALDGKLKFDLSKFNEEYFDRIRSRIIEAGNRGIYVSIMLFNGFSIGGKNAGDLGNPWLGHPYNINNNINNINGDPNQDNNGFEIQTLSIPAITNLQDTYVSKVMDTINDLDNVLFEICNESNSGIAEKNWQYHMIDLIHTYEAVKPKKHPVGMTVAFPGGVNNDLFNSPAEWISPNDNGAYKDNPTPADGGKIIISDTDHLWGIGGDRKWAWKTFTRGSHPTFMDGYHETGFNFSDPTWVSLRKNLGYILNFANRIKLASMVPAMGLASTGYILANPVSDGAEYLVYLPMGGKVSVDLTAANGFLFVSWFNPETGNSISGSTVWGGAVIEFTTPFAGDAILYIYQ